MDPPRLLTESLIQLSPDEADARKVMEAHSDYVQLTQADYGPEPEPEPEDGDMGPVSPAKEEMAEIGGKTADRRTRKEPHFDARFTNILQPKDEYLIFQKHKLSHTQGVGGYSYHYPIY